jgi:hypothetical protein
VGHKRPTLSLFGQDKLLDFREKLYYNRNMERKESYIWLILLNKYVKQ